MYKQKSLLRTLDKYRVADPSQIYKVHHVCLNGLLAAFLMNNIGEALTHTVLSSVVGWMLRRGLENDCSHLSSDKSSEGVGLFCFCLSLGSGDEKRWGWNCGWGQGVVIIILNIFSHNWTILGQWSSAYCCRRRSFSQVLPSVYIFLYLWNDNNTQHLTTEIRPRPFLQLGAKNCCPSLSQPIILLKTYWLGRSMI